MRLLYMTQASPEPFHGLFDEALSYYTVPDAEIGANDVILYGGGTDVEPVHYGQKPNFWTQQPDRFRDEIELEVFHAFKGKVKGFIGICRGAQLLTVLHGGQLIQHIGREHCRDHDIIDLESGRRIPITSAHHQLCWPFNLPEEKYKVLAKPIGRWGGIDKLARVYEREGLHDQLQQDEVPMEPEVIWFPEFKSLGIQGHPEWTQRNHPYARYCRELVTKYILEG